MVAGNGLGFENIFRACVMEKVILTEGGEGGFVCGESGGRRKALDKRMFFTQPLMMISLNFFYF